MKKVVLMLLLAAMCLNAVGCGAGSSVEDTDEEKYIGEEWSNYVFYPASIEGFIGDTMPFYDGGKFNVFYLADQRNGKQGYHPWGLIKTEDFASFDDKGVVINYGDTVESQDIALGTGSVIKDKDGMYHAFYTGHNDTYSPKEAVMHAISSDMENWEKVPEDTFTSAGNYSKDDFRDPYVMYSEEDKCYLMFVTTRTDKGGVIVKYSSNDLKTWKDEGVFFENDMGNDSNMECPTVLKYKDKWYLSFSDQWPNRQVHYRISDSLNGTFEKPANDVFDCNGFYAGRLETDGENLYVVGWCGTKKNHQDGDEYDWGGNMVTHLLKQNADGTLNPVIPTAIESTMKNECTLSPVKMTDTVKEKNGSYTFSGNDYETVGFNNIMGSYLFETTVSDYDENGMFGICFNTNDESVGNLNIMFNAATNRIEFYNNSDIIQTTAQSSLDYDLSKADKLHIKAVISDGVVVMYVNDQVAFTTRMYLSQGSQWGLFSIKSPVTFTDTKLYK